MAICFGARAIAKRGPDVARLGICDDLANTPKVHSALAHSAAASVSRFATAYLITTLHNFALRSVSRSLSFTSHPIVCLFLISLRVLTTNLERFMASLVMGVFY